MPRRSRMVIAGLFLVLSTAAPRNQNLKPADGYVPDESTAVAIGEAVMVPIWGTAAIARHRPYRAALADGLWTVRGTLPVGSGGGTAVVVLAKDDGRIVRAFHEQ